MPPTDRPTTSHDPIRRSLVLGGGIAAGVGLAQAAAAQTPIQNGATQSGATQTDTEPRVLADNPMPEPPPAKSAGPVRPGRGSQLAGKVAVVTGAARGIGRAIAVEFAANGADVVAIDICGPVSPASNARPATPEELGETVDMIKAYGRRGEGIRADIRDIAALRQIADRVAQDHGRIDIVVADAAIQRWVPLLEMQDSDWFDVIDNNLNGTANTIRAFAPKMVAQKQGPHHRALVDAGAARHQGCGELFRLQMGHHRADEIGGDGTGRAQHYGERAAARPRGHAAHALRNAALAQHGRAHGEPAPEPHAATGLGCARAHRAAEGRLAAT